MSPSVRRAAPADLPTVMTILDAGLLDTPAGDVRERIVRGDVLVAVESDRCLGAIVLDGGHVEAIAVRPRRRGQGIGTRLVDAGVARRGSLTAEFDARVRPFYAALGFAIEPLGDGRYRGVHPGD